MSYMFGKQELKNKSPNIPTVFIIVIYIYIFCLVWLRLHHYISERFIVLQKLMPLEGVTGLMCFLQHVLSFPLSSGAKRSIPASSLLDILLL